MPSCRYDFDGFYLLSIRRRLICCRFAIITLLLFMLGERIWLRHCRHLLFLITIILFTAVIADAEDAAVAIIILYC